MKPIPTRRLKRTLLVLLAAAWVGHLPLPGRAQTGPSAPPPLRPGREMPAPPPATLRFQRNVPGDSQPILLDADEILTWKQQGQRVILLQDTERLLQIRELNVNCFQLLNFVLQDDIHMRFRGISAPYPYHVFNLRWDLRPPMRR